MQKLERVDFVNVVNFGGSLRSASTKPSGASPGEQGFTIELTDDLCFVRLSKPVNGKLKRKMVPMTNISSFDEPEVEEQPVKKTK